jgi:ATP-dependent DNA ligase
VRRRGTDYAGATGRTPLERVRELGAGWAIQPKVDGAYARVHLDGRGRVVNVFSRAGRLFPVEQWADLRGALVGAPHAELVGELEAHTEAGNTAARARGHRAVHLFDVIHDGRRRLVDRPYRERYAALCWMQAEAASRAESGRWQDEDQGVRDRVTGRWSREALGAAAIARAPVVPQLGPGAADRAWADWVADAGGEGLVVVNLEAPLGARGAKRKVKARETLDCRVIAADRKAAIVAAGPLRFVVSARRDRPLAAGDVVEVAHEGFYSSGVPRFARILRARPDLGGMIAPCDM